MMQTMLMMIVDSDGDDDGGVGDDSEGQDNKSTGPASST